MPGKALLATVVLAAVPLARAQSPEQGILAPPRISALASAALSAGTPAGGTLAAGGRLALRLGAFEVGAGLDAALLRPGQTEFRNVMLLSAGVLRRVRPRWTAQAAGTAGFYFVQMRDYIEGGSMFDASGALGVRIGVERRLRSSPAFAGANSIAPVVGLSATALYLERGSNRLRGMEWGGAAAFLTLTVGMELASVPPD